MGLNLPEINFSRTIGQKKPHLGGCIEKFINEQYSFDIVVDETKNIFLRIKFLIKIELFDRIFTRHHSFWPYCHRNGRI